MKKFFLGTFMVFLSALSVSAKGNTLDTLCVTTTPVMHCNSCETKIKSNIRFVKGVKRIDTSIPSQRVTIVFDKTKSTYTDFVEAFSKIGYKITNCKAK